MLSTKSRPYTGFNVWSGRHWKAKWLLFTFFFLSSYCKKAALLLQQVWSTFCRAYNFTALSSCREVNMLLVPLNQLYAQCFKQWLFHHSSKMFCRQKWSLQQLINTLGPFEILQHSNTIASTWDTIAMSYMGVTAGGDITRKSSVSLSASLVLTSL